MHDELALRAEGDVGARDARLDLHRRSRRRGADRREPGLVLVAQRQVHDEVFTAPNSQPRELLG